MKKKGDLLNRLSSDTAIIGESLGGTQLAVTLRTFVQLIGSFGFMIYLSPQLTMIMSSIVPIGVIASIFHGRFVRTTQEAVQNALENSTTIAEEKLLNIRTVRYFGNEKRERNKYYQFMQNVFNLSVFQSQGSAYFFGGTGCVGNLLMLTVLAYGSTLVQAGVMSGIYNVCIYVCVCVCVCVCLYG